MQQILAVLLIKIVFLFNLHDQIRRSVGILHQEAGAIGLMTFALCTFVALSGFGMVAALLATTLKHLRCIFQFFTLCLKDLKGCLHKGS